MKSESRMNERRKTRRKREVDGESSKYCTQPSTTIIDAWNEREREQIVKERAEEGSGIMMERKKAKKQWRNRMNGTKTNNEIAVSPIVFALLLNYRSEKARVIQMEAACQTTRPFSALSRLPLLSSRETIGSATHRSKEGEEGEREGGRGRYWRWKKREREREEHYLLLPLPQSHTIHPILSVFLPPSFLLTFPLLP